LSRLKGIQNESLLPKGRGTGYRRREEQVKGSRDSETVVNSEAWLNEIE
jgi:hypothetical protein